MVQMSGIYEGDKRCNMSHGPSGESLKTDAPKDNNGKSEAFSPTDLVGAALGSCILTTLAIVSERDGLDIRGSRFNVKKEMNANPRRIASLALEIFLPKSFSPELRNKYEKMALACPVHRSLHPEVQTPITFFWEI